MALGQFKVKFGVQVADNTNTAAPANTISGYDLLPVGSIMYFPTTITQSVSSGILTTNAPAGWALCDGSAISRSQYSDLSVLLSTISYPYGTGDGSTTFNIPHAGGRALIHGTFPTINSGAETYTLLDSNILSHSHTLSGHNHPLGSHTHPGTSHTHTNSTHSHAEDPHNHGNNTGGDSAHSHSYYYTTPGPSGTGQVRNSTTAAPTFTTHSSTSTNHSHGLTSVAPGIGPSSVLSGSTSNFTSDAPGNNTSGDASPTTTGYNGVSTRSSFSLMQPYVVMSVLIKVY